MGFSTQTKMFRNEVGHIINISAIEADEQRIAQQYVQPDDVVLELGARYGTVTAVIQSKLARKRMHVAVEPDSRVIDSLKKNLQTHNSEALVFHGIVSKRPGKVEGNGYGTIVRLDQQGVCCSKTTVADLEAILGQKFTVLIADCEGCLGPFLADFPELLDQLRLVHFETDSGYNQTNYEQVKQLLRDHGFRQLEHSGIQVVFERHH